MRLTKALRFCTFMALVILPATAFAQSAIVGTVRDTSGAVLPGVTVEATSPALIEKTRSSTTDDQGQYRLVDLRPGTYTVRFRLDGFSAFERVGIVLQADFTASVNAELRVGSLEESITVTGAAPLVDVAATSKREVVDKALLELLPTSRTFVSTGATIPGVNQGQGDVGGSAGNQQGVLTAFGGRGTDLAMEIDGVNVMSVHTAGGWVPSHYHNQGEFQEMVYQVAGGAAESQTPGVKINMIPKEGGNQVHGGLYLNYATGRWQSNNLDSQLIQRGYQSVSRLDEAWDINPDVGGPIKQDRVWFFFSYRNWTYNNIVGNIFWKDGSPGKESGLNQAYSSRVTMRLSQRDKLNVSYNRYPRTVDTRGINNGTTAPEATQISVNPNPYISQAKWTSTPAPNLLIEAGGLYNHFINDAYAQPGVRRATCFVAFAACPAGTNYGDIAKLDLITGLATNAPTRVEGGGYNGPTSNLQSSVSYISGAHQLKAGTQLIWGYYENHLGLANGDLRQNYRNGVPDSVDVFNTPGAARNDLNRHIGVFVQDSWRLGRLTLNPGVRFEYLRGSVSAVDMPAGRFVPARHFDAIPNYPNWKNTVPRFGAAYDLTGNGRTAIKASVGQYMQQDMLSFAGAYNPAVSSTDRRTWRDLNGDDIAQEEELGPSTNRTFGIRANRNPDPNFKRPFQIIYNAGIQHELSGGLSLSFDYYRRTYHQIAYTRDLVAGDFAASYTTVTIPDPRGNGETLTVYNLRPELVGLVNQLDTISSNNSRTFDAVDIGFRVRFTNRATLNGGVSTGKLRAETCDVTDPNLLRTCVTNFPWRTQFKVTGTYTLPYQLHVSGTFMALPSIVDNRTASTDGDVAINYLVNRTIVPTLTTPQVTIRLNQPGTKFLDRINQVDFNLSRDFVVGGVRLRPMFDLFNALNINPVLNANQTFGSSLDRPLVVLPGRLVRLSARVDF